MDDSIGQLERILEAFDARWNPGRHADKIESWKNRVKNLKDAYNKNCTDKGKDKC